MQARRTRWTSINGRRALGSPHCDRRQIPYSSLMQFAERRHLLLSTTITSSARVSVFIKTSRTAIRP